MQVAYNLYATTMVTSAAHDAARRAAGASRANDADAEARATERVKELLGRYGDEHVESVDLETDGEHLALRVVAKNPSLLPPVIRRPLGFDRIDRTVRIRLEREVAP